MSGVIALLIFFWIPAFIVIVKNIFWDLYLWQVKEYRLDRMMSHLLNQEEDAKQSIPIYAGKVFSFLSLVMYLLSRNNFFLFPIAVIFFLYVVEMAFSIQLTAGRKLIRPKISIRNIIVFALSLIVIAIPFFLILYSILIIYEKVGTNLQSTSGMIQTIDALRDLIPKESGNLTIYPMATLILLGSSFFAVAFDLMTPIIVSTWVFFTEPLSQIRRFMLTNKAKQKIAAMKDLEIIGITGSFGKTTTKEIIYTILKQKFKVVKTPKNYNSAVGVAIAVDKFIKPETEIFIAEIGAYTKNEVKKATDVAKPDISIVTGIDSQHVSLFGSKENILKAKFEIIDNAKENAHVILNADNEYTLRMASMTDKETLMYFTIGNDKKIVTTNNTVRKGRDKFPRNSIIFAHTIRRSEEGVDFSINFCERDYLLKTNIQGIHNVSNVLAAIATAIVLGMEMDEIVKIINATKFELPYLNRRNGLNSTIILDDGYNANSTGFLAALDELEAMKKQSKANRKIIMTKGIIELGWEQKKVYGEIAKKIVKVSNVLITSDSALAEEVQKEAKNFHIEFAPDIESFVKAYNKTTEQNDIVLLEGPMDGRVLREIIDES